MSNPWKDREARNAIERNGVIVESAVVPGWKFKLRRMCNWNVQYSSALARIGTEPATKDLLERQRAPDYVADADDAALDNRILLRAFVEGCLVDWRGVSSPDDTPGWPFNVRNAVTLLESFPDIYSELQIAARDPARFKANPTELVNAVRGNSQREWSSWPEPNGATASPRSHAPTAG